MRYTVEELEAMPTIHSGQYDDLKIETETMRVWLSRMGPEDGETQPITIERLIDGRWEDVTEGEL